MKADRSQSPRSPARVVTGGALACLTLLAPVGCYYHVTQRNPERCVLRQGAGLRKDIAGLVHDAQQRCEGELRPRVHCEQPGDDYLCQRIPGTDVQLARSAASRLTSYFSFVHLSDAQLRDESVAMVEGVYERLFDGVVPGVDRNDQLEQYDVGVLLATVLGINELARGAPKESARAHGSWDEPLPPKFVVHTGDSVDAGLRTELDEFINVMRELDVPFFNVVGNHDNQFFGTLPPPAREKGKGVSPLRSTRDFIREHDGNRSRPRRKPHQPSAEGLPRDLLGQAKAKESALPTSNMFGFDLYQPECRPCGNPPGYYAFKAPLPQSAASGAAATDFCPDQDVDNHSQRQIVFIALNTATVVPTTVIGGLLRESKGEIDPEQEAFLEETLYANYDRCTWFIVGAHHPIRSMIPGQRGGLLSLLTENGRVLAYLSGHTHKNAINRYPATRQKPPELWEVVAGSTLIYPQFGLWIDLLVDDAKPYQGFLRVRSFRQKLSDHEAARPSCVLAEYARLGRDGAREDRIDDAWTEDSDAIHRANGLLPVQLR